LHLRIVAERGFELACQRSRVFRSEPPSLIAERISQVREVAHDQRHPVGDRDICYA
jgi:hypothetical protein